MKRIFLFLLIIIPSCLYSQDQFVIDSLLLEHKQAESDTAKVRLLWDLSDQYQKENFLKALEYADQALNLAMKSGNQTFISSSYVSKGTALFRIGFYDEALKSFLEGLKIAEAMNDLKIISKILNNLGVLYDRLHKYDKALETYLKTLEVYNSMPEAMQLEWKGRLSFYYHNIGSIYLTRQDFATAETYFLKALDIAVSDDDKYLQGVIYNNMGKTYQLRKDHAKALEYLNMALKVREAEGDKAEIVKSYYFLMAYYMRLSDYKKALEMAKPAYQLAEEVGSVEWTKWITKSMFTIYGNLGETEAALWAHQQYKIMSDSLMNEQTITKLARTQMQYDYEKKEQSRIALQQHTRLIYIIFISISLFSTAMIALLYVLAKTRGKKVQLEKDKLEQDLEIKNKELTTNVMYLLKKNEFMNNVSDRLLNMKSRLKGENRDTIQQLILDLQSAVDHDVWAEFEMRFQQVHNDFFIKLKEISTDLSPAELKICAFLRLNMKTKEISAITHLSVRTIEVTRSNIRKKLNLTHSEVNLITYLNEF